jgi:hypothetical protein
MELAFLDKNLDKLTLLHYLLVYFHLIGVVFFLGHEILNGLLDCDCTCTSNVDSVVDEHLLLVEFKMLLNDGDDEGDDNSTDSCCSKHYKLTWP